MLQLGIKIGILIIGLAFLILWSSKNWFLSKPKGYEITLVCKKSVSCNPIYMKCKIAQELYPLSSKQKKGEFSKDLVAKGDGFINLMGKYLEEKRIFRFNKE